MELLTDNSSIASCENYMPMKKNIYKLFSCKARCAKIWIVSINIELTNFDGFFVVWQQIRFTNNNYRKDYRKDDCNDASLKKELFLQLLLRICDEVINKSECYIHFPFRRICRAIVWRSIEAISLFQKKVEWILIDRREQHKACIRRS